MDKYESIIKKRMIPKYPIDILGGKFHNRAPKGMVGYPHIFKHKEDNFIDGQPPIMKRIRGNLQDGKIYYNCAEHLNSSQAMCISFFIKFFENPEYEHLFLKLLSRFGIAVDNSLITDAIFEYEPDRDEGTNFDFFLKLSDGRNISWEVKFTEVEFGRISYDISKLKKYCCKWQDTYIPLLRKCAYFNSNRIDDGCHCCLNVRKSIYECIKFPKFSSYEFYQHYQIHRNIAYAESIIDYVLFLSPRENYHLNNDRAYIDKFAQDHSTSNIKNIYWEDLLDSTLDVVSNNAGALEYFRQFKYKYFE